MMEENIPLYDIRIDKEGTWYFRGAEMFRREIVNYFYEHIRLDSSGRYLIELPGDRCYVDVEDTAFVVKGVHFGKGSPDGGEGIIATLSDDSVEMIDPDTLCIGLQNVIYCSVKKGAFTARFSRAGYYQLAERIEYDVEQDSYYLSLNDRRFDLHHQST